ncbi:MAG: hypothetical protein K9M54_10140 [Kiritimatiellales bacterium]|nr:hypothetical protein [Kiritimatiellales bacterium]
MKGIGFVSVLLMGIMASAMCSASVIYSESFAVTTNSGIAAVGWHSNLGSIGTAANENNLDGFVSPVIVAGSSGYLFYNLPTNYTGTPVLNWTDEGSFGPIGKIISMHATLVNNSITEDLKFAIKVDGAWYVSLTVYNSPVPGGGGASVTNVAIDVQSVLWNSLVLDPGTTLAEGGAASLPLFGTVQAVGIFDTSDSNNRVRYYDFVVNAVPGMLPYQEDFTNLGVADGPLSLGDWHVNMGADAVAADEDNGNGALGPVIAAGDYLFYNLDAAYNNAPVLSWTEVAFGLANNITNIAITMRNQNVAEDLKLALKVAGSWYVSTNMFSSLVSEATRTVSLDFPSFSWNSLSFVSGSVLAEGGAASPPSGPVEGVGIFDASGTSGQRVRILHIAVEGLESTYDTWTTGFGLFGPDAAADYDFDQDGMANLVEYALGGNPTNADAAAVLPISSITASSGTNWLEYVYRRRSDAGVQGLTYEVLRSTDLVLGPWTNSNIVAGGSGSINAEFDSVTNLVSTDVESKQFVKLDIGIQ